MTDARALDRGWAVAATPPGAIADVAALDARADLAWIATTAPTTAAGALRAAGAWSFDTPRAFDGEDWWWRCDVDGLDVGVTYTLGLDGIATLFDAWWNGEPIASGANMFLPQRAHVIARGGDRLVIRCRALAPELAKKRPRPRWRVPMLEQQQLRWIRTTLLGRTPGWSPPCPPVGPWRPVWIAPADAVLARDVELAVSLAELDADRDRAIGHVRVRAPLPARVGYATVAIARGEVRHEVALARGADGAFVGTLVVEDPARWWPHTHGEPARYAVELRLDDGPPIALPSIGFRTVALDRGTDGADFALVVNGVRVFCRGACWTPIDPVTLAATPAAYTDAARALRDAGLNMLRIGGTMVYEDRALLDALDAHGILLWQDLMFANMDYPDDEAARATYAAELAAQLPALAARPCLALVCGNSEGGQQAAMAGATRDRWEPPLFHAYLRDLVAAALPDVPYAPSSTVGGAFPHQVDAGATSYYGVGAYLRPLTDARTSGLVFASEALAFANVPDDGGLPGGGALRVHHAAWKARAPRDLGAGWDFDDVRDHYVGELFGIDPAALRYADHERYLALGRFATGEVMARAFAEWRRAASRTRGALVWFWRDLWPGAGWGLLDARGEPKPCWYAVARACAPRACAITDEGNNGLVLHACNDGPDALAATATVTLYRAGEIVVTSGRAELAIPAHGATATPIAALFEGWYDLSYAFRFGPPACDLVHAQLRDAAGEEIAEAFAFPVGLPRARELDVGLAVTIEPGDQPIAVVSTRRFAFAVALDAPGFVARDRNFHLAPGQVRRIALRRTGAIAAPKGIATALNSEATARFG